MEDVTEVTAGVMSENCAVCGNNPCTCAPTAEAVAEILSEEVAATEDVAAETPAEDTATVENN